MGTRASLRGVAGAALIATALVVLPGVAAAAQQPPPWYHASDPTSECVTTYYAGYTISTNSPGIASRTQGTYGPVDLTRDSNAPDGCSDWEPFDADPNVPGLEGLGWPSTWSAGSIQLKRAVPVQNCPSTATTCSYFVVGGNGENFWFFAGTPPTDPNTNQPNPDPGSFNQQNLTLAPPGDVHFGTVNAVGTSDPNGGPGKISVNVSGTTDDENKTPFTYDWVLTSESGTSYSGSSTAPDGAFDWTVSEDGNYCVQLTVTAADGYKKSSAACNGGTGGDYVFKITGVAPEPSPGFEPNPTPKPGPTPGPGSGGGGGPTPGGGVFFARPARAPSTLTGGGGATPTIVWLWRPEWYEPKLDAEGKPQTAEPPQLTRHRDIVVSTGPEGASAGPWLAGLSAFGLLGGGWMMSRRRRLRMLGEI